MITRRTFLKKVSLAGGAVIFLPVSAYTQRSKSSAACFALHQFIENNPDAVFIMKTQVDTKFNAEAIKQAGLDFGRSVFFGSDDPENGIPLDHAFAIKPNLTSRGAWQPGYTVEGTMGVITDANFVEGVIESMKETGIAADHIHIREVNGVENLSDGGYQDMADRTGADVQIINQSIGNLSEDKIYWRDVPEGVYFNKIPFLKPVNTPNSWLLNISKFKAHSMGLTLCAKNVQGAIAAYYQQHCNSYRAKMSISSEHIRPNVWNTIKDNYDRHVAEGIPRWDTPGWDFNGGLGMETWVTRCLDNNSITRPGLHVIEGIYGRDGNFVLGPHDGLAEDFMTNVIIFGKNAFHVDIIGHWLAGHEPGNFGLFHIALERGLSSLLNPMAIPVYEWKTDGAAILTDLNEFERTPLLTRYLWQQDKEEEYHMVDEPYDYPTAIADAQRWRTKPETFLLHQNYPNPFNPNTTIQFNLPRASEVRLEIFDSRGRIVDVLVEGKRAKGAHMAVWQAGKFPSGTYFYRLRVGSFSETRKMAIIK